MSSGDSSQYRSEKELDTGDPFWKFIDNQSTLQKKRKAKRSTREKRKANRKRKRMKKTILI